MARLYANENFPLPVVDELRRLGHEVLTTRESGRGDQAIPDDAVLQFARSHNMALLTVNRRHFIRLHKTDPSHAGIIACTFDPDFPRQAASIDREIRAAVDLQGKLLRVNCPPA